MGGVTVEMMQKLLADTQQAIIANQRDIMREELQQLETRNDVKFAKVQQTLESHDSRVEAVEKAIRDLQARGTGDQASTTVGSEASGGRDETRDRRTIVVGGWPRDTKTPKILEAMDKLVRDLDLRPMVDRDAFVTGPRRSYCMISFQPRPQETKEDCKERMYRVINKIMAAKVKVPHQARPLWASVAKSASERQRTGHCGLVRAIVRYFSAEKLEDLDCEYNKGSCWIYERKVSCAVFS